MKIYFKYILLRFNFLFLKTHMRTDKITTLAVEPYSLYYLTLHIKLSSLFYGTQLIEFFSYELPSKTPENIFVYNFHSVFSQHKILLFVCRGVDDEKIPFNLSSISELFLNAAWLEREASELHGVFFIGKKDIRNLMLQYGDNSSPFQKSFPAIGTKEIFYDINHDLLLQLPVSIQF